MASEWQHQPNGDQPKDASPGLEPRNDAVNTARPGTAASAVRLICWRDRDDV